MLTLKMHSELGDVGVSGQKSAIESSVVTNRVRTS